MPESTIADRIAEADRRIESMSLLCEMLFGHVKHQRRELHELQSALASVGKPEEQRHAVPSDISPDMLAG
jgi:hypothetical protein